MDDARVQGKESRMERGGALGASLLFHVLLLLVLASSTNFDIQLGKESRFDVIFWITPSSVAPQGEQELPLQKNAVRPDPKRAATVNLPAAAAAPAHQPPPPRTAMGVTHTKSAMIHPPASLLSAGSSAMETPADTTLLLTPATRPGAVPAAVKEAKAPASPEKTVEPLAKQVEPLAKQVEPPAKRVEPLAKRVEPPAKRVEPPAKRVVRHPEPEQDLAEALPMPVRLGAFLEERLSGEDQSAGSNEASAAVAATKNQPEAAAATNRRALTAVERSDDASRGAGRAPTAGLPTQRNQPTSLKDERVAEKHQEPRGIVTTSLHGDLKMIIGGDSGVRLLITFREFPKSRRNQPLTRNEARREQRIQPLIAKTDQETREVVVQTARDGIYIFTAEPERDDKAQATFTLKVVEAGGRERSAEIGVRTISGKTILARVLMRDGILWDDAAAFTGRMDDSEGTTKYNVNTGLYWKEFHR